MSWQATNWAGKQRTGSPARKLLLLVLANYADENGVCWPSQETLANDTEQSVDTVQRNAKKLAAAGLVTIERRERKGGRWPKLVYILPLPKEEVTGPQNAARSEASTPVDNSPHRAAPHTITGPHQSRSPGRIAVRHEYLNNNHSEKPPSSSAAVTTPREAKRTGEQKSNRTEAVQHRLAERLGKGDVAQGWLLFGCLTENEQISLTNHERQGRLDDADLDMIRATITLVDASTSAAERVA